MAVIRFRNYRKQKWGIICMLVIAARAMASQTDSLRHRVIPEVVITEQSRFAKVRSAAPLQQFNTETLRQVNALQLSDAIRHFSGVVVRDYGGIGGLKTVSLRSLGANHTGISYDGILLSDIQSGQIDISRFSIENVDRISLSNGQSDRIFLPARHFASAGILDIRSLPPSFVEGRTFGAKVSLKGGSFGLFNPSLLFQAKIKKYWSISFNSEWMRADGCYPYVLRYGDENDLKEKKKRSNTEVSTVRTEAELYGIFSDTHRLRVKAYYYQSSRGLPGATVFYKDYSAQHLWDRNFFLQTTYEKELSSRWDFRIAARYNKAYQHYLNPGVWNINKKEENIYHQQEYYLSASVLYRAFQHLSFSFSTDGAINTLEANFHQYPDPQRYSWLSVLAVKYINEIVSVTGSLLGTVIREKVEFGDCAGNHRKLSPYAAVSVKPFAGEDFRIRLFFKDIFRLPSFNDLYYTRVGNSDLSPESVRQYNLGIAYTENLGPYLQEITCTIDGYYNKVTDKIIAIPTKNIFVWTMMNLGKVDIKGVDVAADISIVPFRKLKVNIGGAYTYQRALDVTDPNNGVYRHQIAYTPRISGSARMGIQTPWLDLAYNLIFSGHRYALGQNFSDNRLPGYTDHSLSVSRSFTLKGMELYFNLEALNLAGKNYEVIRYFPMPGRSFRATLTFKY